MITGRYPVQALAPSSNPHVVEEYLRSVRIKRAEEEVRIRETQLIAQENGFELDLEETRLYTRLDDNYLTGLDSLSSKPKETINENTKELEKFLAYGTEIKYLPLFKYLQVSNKFVGTEEWRVARQEYLTSKAFERYKEACEVQMELQSTINTNSISSSVRRKVCWDGVLEKIKWMAIDFREEREWKRQVAKVLAEEAALYAKCKMKRQPEKERYFYEPTLLPELLERLSIQPTEQPKTTIEISTPVVEKEVTSGPFVMGKGWKEAEDQRLCDISKLYRGNMDLVSEELNYYFHHLGHHKRSPAICQERLRYLSQSSVISISSVGGGGANVLEMLKEGERHFARFSLMQSTRGKLVPLTRITPLTTLKPTTAGTKRPSNGTTVHPSHDAAVKRATQNITRLLTPGELALRRMQRMRQLMEGMRQPTTNSTQPSTLPSAQPSTQGTPLKKHEQPPRESRSTTPTPSNNNNPSTANRGTSKPPSRPSTPKK